MRAAPADRVVSAARAWIGTPYHHQASVRGVGCDCLGLARGVWRDILGAEPADVPAYSSDWGETGAVETMRDGAAAWMLPLDRGLWWPGDLLLFRMARGAIAKHCGILTHDFTFVHASPRLGVVEEAFTPAWSRRVAFAFRYPGVR